MPSRSRGSTLLAWLLLPVAAWLVQASLGLPGRAYTGLALRGDLVATVDPLSPGERAGIAPGDRLAANERRTGPALAAATPGRPLVLLRERNGVTRPVWLVPDPLPPRERRLDALLLVLASAFVMLGGWVWSERRDALTRAFFLVCLAFATLLAPPPQRLGTTGAALGDAVLTAVSLLLPALFVHFFATFPEARARGRRRWWIHAAYVAAGACAAIELIASVARHTGAAYAADAGDVAQLAAAVWLAAGTLVSLALFTASFLRAGSADARRRLRVAFAGSLLGLGPFIALSLFRSLWPGTALPAERGAVLLTLLVPGSFAWAIVVHRVFDFRVALRAGVIAMLVVGAGALAWALGQWGTGASHAAAGLAGGGLATIVLAASLAGPASPLLRSLGARLVPGEEAPPLDAWLDDAPIAGDGSADALLAAACAAVTAGLLLDGCGAVAAIGGEVRVVGGAALPELGPELRQRVLLAAPPALRALDDAGFGHQDREALRVAGVSWLLPAPGARCVLLLGRRLAGAWLSRHEVRELDRLARRLAVALENAHLRRQATTHVGLTRELREAGRMQAHLLPQRVPVSPTLDCAAAVLSTEPVGGDYYDFVEGPDRSFTLAVGDVAGHGIAAALLLSHVQARFRSHAGEALTPGELLAVLNREIADFDQPEKFVGLVCARVDVRRGRIWIANAGLTPPLLRRADGRLEEIEASGTLLGVQRGTRYAERCLDLGRDDVLLVHTDGLSEAQRGDELFGMDRTRESLRALGGRRAVDVMDSLLAEVRAWADQPLDDLTLVVLRQLATPPSGPPEISLKQDGRPAEHTV